MYEFLEGTLISKAADHAVLDVGGVGYRMRISFTTFETLPGRGSQVRILTHLHVREDIMDLYGFGSTEEREFFHLLLGVSKIGPKAALTLLSGGTPSEIAGWILLEDAKSLSRLPGIGPTTARRIIVELKPKLEKRGDTISGLSPAPVGKTANSALDEAVLALEALGFSRSDAYGRVRKVLEKLGEDSSSEALIKGALHRE